jgi:hypothetical protein
LAVERYHTKNEFVIRLGQTKLNLQYALRYPNPTVAHYVRRLSTTLTVGTSHYINPLNFEHAINYSHWNVLVVESDQTGKSTSS